MTDRNDFNRSLASVIASLEERIREGVEQPGAFSIIFKSSIASYELPRSAVDVIRVTGLHPVGRGVDRPEHVVVAGDGRVFASDKASAVAELIDENTVRRVGQAGGEPNGIALDRDGHFLIANFGSGVLQDLDPVTGAITLVGSMPGACGVAGVSRRSASANARYG